MLKGKAFGPRGCELLGCAFNRRATWRKNKQTKLKETDLSLSLLREGKNKEKKRMVLLLNQNQVSHQNAH